MIFYSDDENLQTYTHATPSKEHQIPEKGAEIELWNILATMGACSTVTDTQPTPQLPSEITSDLDSRNEVSEISALQFDTVIIFPSNFSWLYRLP
jgi:hypothetical protein